jgi:hypothetical protein
MIDTSISTSETTKIQIQISYDAAKGVTTVARIFTEYNIVCNLGAYRMTLIILTNE